MADADHQGLILDQFTRQATVFSTAPSITDERALQMIVEAARPGQDDTVLDVACGPGLIICAFAPHVRHAAGIDVTPAMLERARTLAAGQGLSNVSWRQGDVYSLRTSPRYSSKGAGKLINRAASRREWRPDRPSGFRRRRLEPGHRAGRPQPKP